MTIEFECGCGELLQVSNEFAGKKGRCPACQKIITVPAIPPEPEDVEEHALGDSGEDHPALEEEEPSVFSSDEQLPDEDLETKPSYLQEKVHWIETLRSLYEQLPKWSIPAAAAILIILVLLLARGGQEPEEMARIDEVEKAEEVVSVSEEPSEPELARDTAAIGTQIQEPLRADSTEPEPKEEPAEIEEPVVVVPSSEMEQPQEEPEESVEEQVARVEERPPAPSIETKAPRGSYTVNIATFREKERADRFAEDLKEKGIVAFVWKVELPEKGQMHRVSTGNFPTRTQAEEYAEDLEKEIQMKTFVVQVTEGND